MRVEFDEFVVRVREPLEVLDVEPAFQHKRGEVARFIQDPYVAELQPVDDAYVRLLVLAHGEAIRTVDLPLTADGAWLCWNGIVAIFETVRP
jgi:hypothetical protein